MRGCSPTQSRLHAQEQADFWQWQNYAARPFFNQWPGARKKEHSKTVERWLWEKWQATLAQKRSCDAIRADFRKRSERRANRFPKKPIPHEMLDHCCLEYWDWREDEREYWDIEEQKRRPATYGA